MTKRWSSTRSDLTKTKRQASKTRRQKDKAERERCANIAETEPELPGPMPPELHLIPLEDALRATVRATKMSIARRIRNCA